MRSPKLWSRNLAENKKIYVDQAVKMDCWSMLWFCTSIKEFNNTKHNREKGFPLSKDPILHF